MKEILEREIAFLWMSKRGLLLILWQHATCVQKLYLHLWEARHLLRNMFDTEFFLFFFSFSRNFTSWPAKNKWQNLTQMIVLQEPNLLTMFKLNFFSKLWIKSEKEENILFIYLVFCLLLPSLSPVELCKGRLQNIYNILRRTFPLAVFTNKNPIKSLLFFGISSASSKKGEVIYQQSAKRVADESFPNIRERQTRSQEDSNVSLRMVQGSKQTEVISRNF